MASTDIGIIVKAEDKASRELKKVEGSLGKLGGAVGVAGKAIAGFTIAAGVAATAFATDAILKFSEVGDAVDKMAKRTGLSATAVSALRIAADGAGTSIDSVETAVKKMNITIDKFADETGALNPLLGEMNLTFDDLVQMSPDQQFEKIGNAIAAIENPSLRTTLAMEAFGKSGTDLIPLFEEGKFSMREWSEEAQRLGVSFDDISANKAAALNDAIGKMKAAWSGIVLLIGGELAPIITEFIENRLVPFINTVRNAIPEVEKIWNALYGMTGAFMEAMDSFEERTGIIGQITEAFSALWAQVQDELLPALTELWDAAQPLLPVFQKMAEIVGTILIAQIKLFIELLAQTISFFITLTAKAAELSAAFLEYVSPAIDTVKSGLDALAGAINWVITKYNQMRDAAIAAMNAARDAVSNIPVVGGLVTGAPGRAVGGPVTAGMPYIVGERGPELFVPGSSGSILPRVPSAGGASALGGVTINIGTFVGGNPEAAARELGDMIIKRLQLNARVG